jgi:hypothetical protein
MKFRWSRKELRESSDARILRGLIAERVSTLNPYAPLAVRLKTIYEKLDKKIQKEEVV